MKPPPGERPRWLDDPAHVTLLYRGVIGVCLGLVALGFVVSLAGHFWWEAVFGFHAMYGFIAYVMLVLIARGLRRLVKRPDNYYER